jgi:hypothetical protein
MAEEIFGDNVLRVIAAELRVLTTMTAAREMFSKSYFSLGVGEKAAVDQALFGMISGNFQMITPQHLAAHKDHQPVGFHAPPKGQS